VATVLAREPGMTESALAQHPMRHVLTSVVGARADTEPRVDEHSFGTGDVVLLCSDGLHGALPPQEIAAIIGSGRPLAEIPRLLVDAALACGATDNVTAVVVRRDA
jgi:PPM family protein phosphatase